MASYSTPTYRPPRAPETNLGAFWMVATVLLGLMVAVVGFFALLMWADARESQRGRSGRHRRPRRPTTTRTTTRHFR